MDNINFDVQKTLKVGLVWDEEVRLEVSIQTEWRTFSKIKISVVDRKFIHLHWSNHYLIVKIKLKFNMVYPSLTLLFYLILLIKKFIIQAIFQSEVDFVFCTLQLLLISLLSWLWFPIEKENSSILSRIFTSWR